MTEAYNITELPAFIQERLTISDTDCWEWTGHKYRNGYGKINKKKFGQWRVHRITYTLLVGEIPAGLVLDHLCRVRHCANPAHLEPVTDRENLNRGFATITTCPQGHEYTPENTYLKPATGTRECRRCRAAQRLKYKAKHVA